MRCADQIDLRPLERQLLDRGGERVVGQEDRRPWSAPADPRWVQGQWRVVDGGGVVVVVVVVDVLVESGSGFVEPGVPVSPVAPEGPVLPVGPLGPGSITPPGVTAAPTGPASAIMTSTHSATHRVSIRAG